MPKALEDALAAQARKQGLKGKAADRYVYGTMNKQGWMHGNKPTQKTVDYERRHGGNK